MAVVVPVSYCLFLIWKKRVSKLPVWIRHHHWHIKWKVSHASFSSFFWGGGEGADILTCTGASQLRCIIQTASFDLRSTGISSGTMHRVGTSSLDGSLNCGWSGLAASSGPLEYCNRTPQCCTSTSTGLWKVCCEISSSRSMLTSEGQQQQMAKTQGKGCWGTELKRPQEEQAARFPINWPSAVTYLGWTSNALWSESRAFFWSPLLW